MLELWLAEDRLRRDARPPGAAIEEARGWLARVEAILRRTPTGTARPVAVMRGVEDPDPDDIEDDDPDDDEALL